MTSELSNFAARLREYILSEGRVSRGPHFEISSQDKDLCNSSLRLDGAFNSLALELFALQFAHNAAYRKISEARGVTPRTVSHWSQIPAVPAAAFKDLELTCLPAAQRTQVFHSSGTTEQRCSRHFHNAESLKVYEDSAWAWFAPHVLPDSGFAARDLQLAILTPPPAQAPQSSLVHMFETARRQLAAPAAAFVGCVAEDGAWELDFDAMLARLKMDSGLRTPELGLLLFGTAFSFVQLLDFLRQENLCFQLPPGSRVMETGGYKGRSRRLPKAELHALFTERLGVSQSQIVCEYGMSELSSQAYDNVFESVDFTLPHPKPPHCPLPPHPALSPDGGEGGRRPGEGVARATATRHFHFSPWSRAQIISPETGREVGDGETGLIRVFDLANVFSVMAIQTEDLGLRRGEGFELMGRAGLAEARGCSLMTV